MGRIQKGIALLDFSLIPFLVFPDLAINFFRVGRVISKSGPELFARQPVIGFLKSFQVFVNAVKCGNYFPDLDTGPGNTGSSAIDPIGENECRDNAGF